jgi:hypothetical protein
MQAAADDGSDEIDRRAPEPAHDLIDFYRRWREFRGVAEGLRTRPDLSAAEREVLDWLIRLTDRVGRADIGG